MGLGTPHHARRRAPLFHHLPHPVGEGARNCGAERGSALTGFAAMRRFLALLLLVASCSQGPEDIAYISQARSLAAEWALINEQASAGRLTGTYAAVMRQSIRQ